MSDKGQAKAIDRRRGGMMRVLVTGLLVLCAVFLWPLHSSLITHHSSLISPSLVTHHSSLAAETPQPKERHLTNVRQLTVGLQNAEAYFSFDGTRLIFQSTHDFGAGASGTDSSADDKGLGCYQMYVMDLSGKDVRRVSPGHGATTCGYFFPGDRRVLYSSTHLVSPACPPKPERGKRYRWALDDYDIFANSLDGQRLFRLTATPGYDAEATISPDGKTIVFTLIHDGAP